MTKTRVIGIPEAGTAYLNNNAIPDGDSFMKEPYTTIYGSKRDEQYNLHSFKLKDGTIALEVLQYQILVSDGSFLVMGLLVGDYSFDHVDTDIDALMETIYDKEEIEDEANTVKLALVETLDQEFHSHITDAITAASKLKNLGEEHSFEIQLDDLKLIYGGEITLETAS